MLGSELGAHMNARCGVRPRLMSNEARGTKNRIQSGEPCGCASEPLARGDLLRRRHLAAVFAGMLLLSPGTGRAATIKVLCDSPLQPALTKVAALFRQETNNAVILA